MTIGYSHPDEQMTFLASNDAPAETTMFHSHLLLTPIGGDSVA